MFVKASRYRNLPNAVARDVSGVKSESKSLRLLTEVSGEFLHTVEENDRLDHLAYKYYRRSDHWWRICDANPEFLSPRSLLGREPVLTYRFPLGVGRDQDRPPWNELQRAVGALAGVEKVAAEERAAQPAVDETENGNPAYVSRWEWALVVRLNLLTVSLEAVAQRVEATLQPTGLEMGTPQSLGRIGREIVIPPRVSG